MSEEALKENDDVEIKETRMPLDRRKPGMLRLTIIVGFLATFVGGITVYTVQVLADDYRSKRDTAILNLESEAKVSNTRLNHHDVLIAEMSARDRAQNEEILRRLTVIEELQRHKDKEK